MLLLARLAIPFSYLIFVFCLLPRSVGKPAPSIRSLLAFACHLHARDSQKSGPTLAALDELRAVMHRLLAPSPPITHSLHLCPRLTQARPQPPLSPSHPRSTFDVAERMQLTLPATCSTTAPCSPASRS